MSSDGRIHCSALPRIMACPASVIPPKVNVEFPDTEAASIGTAVHECCAKMVRNEPYDVASVARTYGVDVKDVGYLSWVAHNIWAEIGEPIRVVAVEAEIEKMVDVGTMLCGRADLIGQISAECEEVENHEQLVVLDWKTGRAGVDHSAQLMGYAWLALNWDRWADNGGEFIYNDGVKLITVWLRESEVDIRDVPICDVQAWGDQLQRVLLDEDRYCPSAETCRFCPRRLECPALEGMSRAAASPFIGLTRYEPAEVMSREKLAELKPRVDLVKQRIEEYEDCLRRALEDGPLPMDAEREVYLAERERATVLSTEKSWEIIEHAIPSERLEEVFDVNKTALLEIVASNAPRGKKGAAKGEVMAQLEEAGAVERKPYKAIATRKRGEEKNNANDR